MGIEALLSTQIIDTTAVGRAVMTAADSAAARTAIGAGTSSFSGAYSALSGIPSTFAPSAHKSSHVTGQPDALSPSDIGAVPTARTLTINGTAFDLSADRSWTVSGGGGVGGSTGAVDNAVLRADGTGGSTVQNSGLIISDTLEMRIGDATNAGKLRLQDSGQYSTTVLFNVFLGGVFLGQDFSTFFIRGNGEVYSYQGYTCSSSGNGFTGHQFVFEGGWGSIRRASSTPTGNGNAIYNTYGLYVTCGAGHGFSVAAGTSTTFIDVFNTFTNSTNYEKAILKFATYSSARYVQLAAESAGTGIANMNLVLSPKGTGALIAGAVPDGTATGGNARGAYAVDLQLYRASATQVASGQDSFAAGYGCTASNQGSICIGWGSTSSGIRSIVIGDQSSASGIQSIAMGGGGAAATGIGSIAIGYYCTASGNTAFSVGYQNLASGSRSVATGIQSLANRHGQRAHAAGSFTDAAQSGQSQCVEFVLRNKTTDGATAVTLFLDGATARLTIRTGTILHATAQVVGSKSDGTAVAIYMRKFAIKNVGGTTTLVGSVETIGTDVAAGTSLSITADDTNDAVNAAVIGINGETWRWVMTVYGVELAYGT